jgi:hypothetical protein
VAQSVAVVLDRRLFIAIGLTLMAVGLIILAGVLASPGDDDTLGVQSTEAEQESAYALWQENVNLGAARSRLDADSHFVGGATVGDTFYLIEANSLSLIEIPSLGQAEVRRLELPKEGKRPEAGDVEVTNTGAILVSDIANAQVWQYASDGRLLGSFLKQESASQVKAPLGLGRDLSGRLLMTDIGDHKVKVFSRTGDLLSAWGEEGQAAGQFSFPNDVLVDAEGRIFVSDSNNRRIQEFDREGRFLQAFRDTDQAEGLVLPRSLAMDGQGHLHVADTLNGRVAVFSKDGVYLGEYGDLGSGEERLQNPEALAIAGSRIIVGDRATGRLSVFHLPL